MNKLRALQYFVIAAQERSFSGAAKRLDLSVPAVARLIGALETSLGVKLFDRGARGLSLTADGAGYLQTCLPLLQALDDADEAIGGASVRPRGTLVLGAPPFLSQHCIMPALPGFHARYPDIQIDIRSVSSLSDAAAKSAEVLILYGWQEHREMIHKRVAQTRSLICASPTYWAAHGVPQRPKDLERHVGLLFRDQEGTILDLWEYEREGVKESAVMQGWLISNHRDVLLDAALAGAGVARFSDLSIRSHLQSGRLVPALLDWETKHAPPINLLYRNSQKRTPRVRLFVEFASTLFVQLESEREPGLARPLAAERPHWYRRRYSRASASVPGS